MNDKVTRAARLNSRWHCIGNDMGGRYNEALLHMHLAWSYAMLEAIKETSRLGRLYKCLGLTLFNERLISGYVLNSLILISVLALRVSSASLGQASVERGFSVSRQVKTENMSDKTYVAQRIICDYANSVGGVLNISVEKGMLLSVAGARQKYMQYLNDKK